MTSRFKTVGGSGVKLITVRLADIRKWRSGRKVSARVANMLPAEQLRQMHHHVEHSPQANNAGDVILADLSAYLLFRREALSIAFSDHYGFVNDMGTWRFTARTDGKPWLKNAITLADPTGSYTVSPFVYHND